MQTEPDPPSVITTDGHEEAEAATMLRVRGLVKTFPPSRSEKDRVAAVNGVSFEVPAGTMFTLLGPSGCGKTTTLRCIAGLERPDSGEIVVSERVLYSAGRAVNLRANERGLGMVFQSYAIWPHMNVFRNVAFPLQVQPQKTRPGKKEISDRVGEVLRVVRLDHLADREATDLSGGQQQRLALARALVMRPPLLLLDEPLSNLDAKLREEMRFEVKRLQRTLGITAVYVTHDQVEALAMSNRIAVMQDGKIEQVGRPRDVYEQPVSRFVADFIGISNFVEGTIEGGTPADGYEVRTAHGPLRARSSARLDRGTPVVLSIRPEHVGVRAGTPASGEERAWPGTVQARAFLGESVDHVIDVGGTEVRARCNPTLSIPAGTEVTLTFDESACTLIPADA